MAPFNQARSKKDLEDLIGNGAVIQNEPMKNHTSYKIGGPADLFLVPTTIEKLRLAVQYCREHELPHFLKGRGSNLLVGDKGFRGVVIQCADNLADAKVTNNTIWAEAGISLKNLADIALDTQLTGLEFAAGIPGTLGGAVTMNAGAYDGEMSQVVKTVQIIDDESSLRTLSLEELNLGYRSSVIQKEGYIVVSATVELARGSAKEIREKMDDLWERRTSKQPLEFPSCGSVFKRPPGHYAGKLIQDAGLRGHRIGGAEISVKHSGFIVNVGDASAADVLAIIDLVKRTVKEKFGVEMETEVRMVGEF